MVYVVVPVIGFRNFYSGNEFCLGLGEALICCCDNLMDGELELSNQVMTGIVVDVCLVVHIVDNYFIVFSFLKVIVDLEVLNPSWIQVIPDNFSFPDLFPLSSETSAAITVVRIRESGVSQSRKKYTARMVA